LPLKVRQFNEVRVNQPNRPDPRSCERQSCWTSESAHADDKHLAVTHFRGERMSDYVFHSVLLENEEPLPCGEEAPVNRRG
jgi:hypothetical protein